MTALTLLAAADLTPYLKIIIMIVAVSVMAINKLLSGLKKSQAKMQPKPDADAAQQPSPARREINDELKEFLRRAAEKRSGASRPAPAPREAARPSQPARTKEPGRPRKQKTAPPTMTTAAAPKLDESLANRRMVSSVNTNTLDVRAQQLSSFGESDQIGAQFKQSPEHSVGHITTDMAPAGLGAADTSERLPTPAAQLFDMLSNPQSLRGAIVLNEILSRPVDRW